MGCKKGMRQAIPGERVRRGPPSFHKGNGSDFSPLILRLALSARHGTMEGAKASASEIPPSNSKEDAFMSSSCAVGTSIRGF